MNRRFKQISFLTIFIAHLSLAQVDVVVFMKNGDRISGQWRGGGEREIHLQVGNQRMNFQVSEVESVAFAADSVSVAAHRYLRNADVFYQRGLLQEAKSLYQKVLEESPMFSTPYYRLAQIVHGDGDVDTALGYLKFACLTDDPKPEIAQLLQKLGTQYLQNGVYDQATVAYSLILEHFPDFPDKDTLAYSTGILLARQSTEPQHTLDLLQSATINYLDHPDFEEASYLIGDLQTKNNQPELAVTTLTNFILAFPDSQWIAEAQLARGSAFLALNQNREAIADFTTVINTPTFPVTLKREARKRRDDSAWSVYRVSDGLPNNQVQAIAIDGNFIWVGTSKGIMQVDITDNSWQPIIEVSSTINQMFERGPINVRAIEATEQGVWVGTMNHGLIYYDKIDQTSINYTVSDGLPHKLVYDIQADELNDEVWVGTFSGVARYRRAIDTWVQYNREENDLPADDIVALAVTPITVWVGTSQSGLAYYSRTEDLWRSYGTFEGLEQIVGKSIISFDTTVDGVFFTWYNRQRQLNGYTEADLRGFESVSEEVSRGTTGPLENIQIAVSDNELWLITNDDVYKRGRYSGKWDQIAYPTDRLGSITVNCIKLGDGVAWIGTSNGLAQLNTQALTVDQLETSSQSEGEVVPVLEEDFLPEGVETQNE